MKSALSVLIAFVIIIGGFLFIRNREATAPTTDTISTTTSMTGGNTPAPGATGMSTTTGSTSTPVTTADIKVASPRAGEVVRSPLTLSGQARGNWFFEASAPVKLVDASGKTLAQGHIQATGDWMTTNLVPFTGTLTWNASSTGTSTAATLVFMNDNPSGNPALQKTVTVPVTLAK